MSSCAFRSSLAAIVLLVLVQSAAHLVAVGPLDTIDSIVDLDRSNGVPDTVSTLAIGVAAVGAAVLAWSRHGWARAGAGVLLACLVLIGVDDVAGVDRDVAAATTLVVTGLAVAAGAGIAATDGRAGRRSAIAISAGLAMLVATLAIGQVPELEQWFEQARGGAVIEARIVIQQGFELAGWGLVGLGLWDAALRKGGHPARPEGPHTAPRNQVAAGDTQG
jgi:hypothetical protein